MSDPDWLYEGAEVALHISDDGVRKVSVYKIDDQAVWLKPNGFGYVNRSTLKRFGAYSSVIEVTALDDPKAVAAFAGQGRLGVANEINRLLERWVNDGKCEHLDDVKRVIDSNGAV